MYLIPILLLLVLFWLFVVIPQRRRRRSHEAMQDSVRVGDEIITAGGLHGEVVAADDDVARIEIAPGVVVTLDRRAIAAVARDVEDGGEPFADEEPDVQEETPEHG